MTKFKFVIPNSTDQNEILNILPSLQGLHLFVIFIYFFK